MKTSSQNEVEFVGTVGDETVVLRCQEMEFRGIIISW
jgi:hypothetical protein